MDAERLAAAIIERAKKEREEREQDRQRKADEAKREAEFQRNRRIVYKALTHKQTERVDEAAKALLEIGDMVNPRGADFWVCEFLDTASQGNSWPHGHFGLLIARTAFFDQNEVALRSLLTTAMTSDELPGVGDVLCIDVLECLWARAGYSDTLPNGQPNLEATPFTTAFETVGDFATALSSLPGFSRATLDRRLKRGELLTEPAWKKSNPGPHRFKFRDAATQRAVLAHLRSNRTPVKTVHRQAGGDGSTTATDADESARES